MVGEDDGEPAQEYRHRHHHHRHLLPVPRHQHPCSTSVTRLVARGPSLRTRDGARGEGAEVEEGGHPALLLRVQLQPEVGHGRVVQLPVVRGQVGGQVGSQGGGQGGGRGAG